MPAHATGPVLIYPVLEAWPESTSWRNQPGYADEPSATVRLEPKTGWKLFDVTDAVRAQMASPEKFHGVMLRFGNEDHVASKSSTYEFASREAEGDGMARAAHAAGRRSPARSLAADSMTGRTIPRSVLM